MNDKFINSDSGGRFLNIIPDDKVFENMELRLIDSIAEEHILKPSTGIDGENKLLCYKLTGLISLEEYLSTVTTGEKEIYAIFSELEKTADILSGYLMGEENILLDKDCIFVDKLDKSLRFCVYPEAEKELAARFRDLIAALIAHTDIEESGVLRQCAAMMKEANKENCRTYDIMDALLAERMERKGKETLGAERTKDIKDNAENERYKAVSFDAEDKFFKNNQAAQAAFKGSSRMADDKEYKSFLGMEDLDDMSLESLGFGETKIVSDDKDRISANSVLTPQDELNAVPKENKKIFWAHRKKNKSENNPKKPKEEQDNNPKAAAAMRVIITQIIMLIGLAVVFLLKGMPNVINVLPIYAILSVCSALYFSIDLINFKKSGQI